MLREGMSRYHIAGSAQRHSCTALPVVQLDSRVSSPVKTNNRMALTTQLLMGFVFLFSYITAFVSNKIPHRHTLPQNHRSRSEAGGIIMSEPRSAPDGHGDGPAQVLMELASAHFASQALHAFVKLHIPDILSQTCYLTVDEIAEQSQSKSDNSYHINRDGLQRILRLLSTVGVVSQKECGHFGLTEVGALLRTATIPAGQLSLAPVIFHWMEAPLWNAWSELPMYVAGQGDANNLPFERVNGISSDEYYSSENQESLQYANDFVKYISSGEERAVLEGFDWTSLAGKTLIDVGGHQGKIVGRVSKEYPDIKCLCFDLPEVISSATAPSGVELVSGDIFDGNLPPCDVILMKHFLDKCMWTEDQTKRILINCRDVLPEDGKIVIAEAVLPDDAANASGTNRLHLFIDVLFLLVGRDAARTESEWRILAENAGLEIETINHTASPSCYMIVMNKKRN